jgi:hypothetical protein
MQLTEEHGEKHYGAAWVTSAFQSNGITVTHKPLERLDQWSDARRR